MKNDKNEIMVSVIMTAYNHEKYIKQAVDAVLVQKTNFRYELIIGDDASTDSTQEILKQYSGMDNIRLFLRKENAKGKNSYLLMQQTKGKYIFFCNGDDYWIGENILQEFVDFLEEHPKYFGISGRRVVLSEKTKKKWINLPTINCNQSLSLKDFLQGKNFDYCATLHRNMFHDGKFDYRTYRYSRCIGDLTMAILILLHGPIYITDKIMGVYRTDRIKKSSSYNATRSKEQIYEDHIDLIHQLEKKLPIKLDYTGLKIKYTNNYLNNLPNVRQRLKVIPYMIKKLGKKFFIDNIQKLAIFKRK